jgi:hypothetical protein
MTRGSAKAVSDLTRADGSPVPDDWSLIGGKLRTHPSLVSNDSEPPKTSPSLRAVQNHAEGEDQPLAAAESSGPGDISLAIWRNLALHLGAP